MEKEDSATFTTVFAGRKSRPASLVDVIGCAAKDWLVCTVDAKPRSQLEKRVSQLYQFYLTNTLMDGFRLMSTDVVRIKSDQVSIR